MSKGYLFQFDELQNQRQMMLLHPMLFSLNQTVIIVASSHFANTLVIINNNYDDLVGFLRLELSKSHANHHQLFNKILNVIQQRLWRPFNYG